MPPGGCGCVEFGLFSVPGSHCHLPSLRRVLRYVCDSLIPQNSTPSSANFFLSTGALLPSPRAFQCASVNVEPPARSVPCSLVSPLSSAFFFFFLLFLPLFFFSFLSPSLLPPLRTRAPGRLWLEILQISSSPEGQPPYLQGEL